MTFDEFMEYIITGTYVTGDMGDYIDLFEKRFAYSFKHKPWDFPPSFKIRIDKKHFKDWVETFKKEFKLRTLHSIDIILLIKTTYFII